MATGIVIALFLVFGVATMVVGLVAYVLLVLMLLMHLPVGLDALLACLHVQTAVEPTPPGQATVFHVVPHDGAKFTAVLRHSALYDDPEVIRFVASWIRVRLTCEVVVQ